MIRIDTCSKAPDRLDQLIDYYLVSEGWHYSATYTPKRPYLVTLGLYVCKGLSIYDPASQTGLLAHAAYIDDLDEYVDAIVDDFEGDIASSDVYIAKATQDDIPQYPDLDKFAASMSRYSPHSITLDPNHAGLKIRGTALDLNDGGIYEADYSNMDLWSRSQDTPRTASLAIMYEE